jgi:hypothetical protein
MDCYYSEVGRHASQRWRALQRVMLSPTTIGDITTARTLLKAWPLTA